MGGSQFVAPQAGPLQSCSEGFEILVELRREQAAKLNTSNPIGFRPAS
jgi:hypothetical protein